MEYVQIPVPDFSFEEIVKRQARSTANAFLGGYSLRKFASTSRENMKKFYDAIDADFNYYNSKASKIQYTSEFILYLSKLFNQHLATVTIVQGNSFHTYDDDVVKQKIDEVKFHLYERCASIGYNFDKNAFSDNEINDLNKKVDAILEQLNKIQLGQEILFDDLAELKEDFASLKADFPLGKKRWHQRAAGIVASYIGNKGADELYEALKPLLRDFFINTAPHLIDKL